MVVVHVCGYMNHDLCCGRHPIVEVMVVVVVIALRVMPEAAVNVIIIMPFVRVKIIVVVMQVL